VRRLIEKNAALAQASEATLVNATAPVDLKRPYGELFPGRNFFSGNTASTAGGLFRTPGRFKVPPELVMSYRLERTCSSRYGRVDGAEIEVLDL
jgi:hypothetical protein